MMLHYRSLGALAAGALVSLATASGGCGNKNATSPFGLGDDDSEGGTFGGSGSASAGGGSGSASAGGTFGDGDDGGSVAGTDCASGGGLACYVPPAARRR